MTTSREALVAQIHAAPPKIVYAFAGGGSQALWDLHRVVGSSRTILEAIDCYAPQALADLLGAPPAQAVSATTARAMADWAYRRAGQIVEHPLPILGLGCTAALATDRMRRGVDRCVLSVQGTMGARTYTLTLAKSRGRLTQENLISDLVISALAIACGISTTIELDLQYDEELTEDQYEPR